MSNINILISEDLKGNRIDKILYNYCQQNNINLTRNKIQTLIKERYLLKNNIIFTDISYKVKLEDNFIFNIPIAQEKKLQPTKIPLNIIYEDEDVLVINKQAGLTTHPGAGNETYTLANALLEKYGNNLSKIGGEFRPGILHRLDKDTSGLMLVAKNDKSHLELTKQLQERVFNRTYIAFVWGVLKPQIGKIEGYIERSKTNRLKMEMTNNTEARYSLTNYKTIKTFLNNSISMVEFNLDTGRTHQIRVHCSYLKCPLIGDQLYGGKSRHLTKEYENLKTEIDAFHRQALHSYKLRFLQPTTHKELNFEIDLPDDMKKLYTILKSNS